MEMVNPPKWLLRFFRWFCAAELHIYIEGDLLELYGERLKVEGKRKADKRLFIDILMLFRPSIIRPFKGYTYSNNNAMFKNYFKIAFRTLWKNKAYAGINILGLAISIAGASLLLTYVNSELSFDRFHGKAKRIIRPIVIQLTEEGDRYFASNPAVYVAKLAEEMPEIQDYVNLVRLSGQFNVLVDNQAFTAREYFFSSSKFFKIFDYKLIKGNVATVLDEPYSIVLSEQMAIKLFGSLDVIGRSIESPQSSGNFKITGVMADLPDNTHIDVDILISDNSIDQDNWNNVYLSWSSFSATSYLLIKDNVDLNLFSTKANEIADKNFPEEISPYVNFDFQPLLDIHFGSAHIERDIAMNKGDQSYIKIFVSISVFLLVIAAVNYMNLATSKAIFRAKEIGVRKVIGAQKSQLAFQFFIESFVITSIAMLLSIGLMDLSMPLFNQLTGKSFDFSLNTLMEYLPLVLSITALIGLLAGVYPAIFMTRFKPVDVLKGEKVTGGAFNVRKGLVVFQFVLSTVLIISTLVVSNQMGFISSMNLGFDKENLLVIDINNGAVRPVFKTMRSEFEQISGVTEVAVASRVPGEWKNIDEVAVSTLNAAGEIKDSIGSYYMSFDPHVLSAFNMKLKEGSFFTGSDQSDSTKILINETAAKRFGLVNPIGEIVTVSGRGSANYTIIGVIEDFNFKSLHTPLEPLVIGAWNNPNSIIDYFILKISGDPKPIIEAATAVHTKFDNRTVIEYHFLDSQLASFYEKEQEASTIFKLGAGLSIFIACLGLFGLVSFTLQRRRKELGVRKVLGAGEWKLFFLLSTSFGKQILLAFIIASPLAYYLMHQWLRGFEYRVGLGIGTFLLAGFSVLLLAMITVSYMSLKAANSNPVSSLRSE